MALKTYTERHAEIEPTETWEVGSGVACPGKEHSNNEAEMMLCKPVEMHPTLTGLRRARCGDCGYLGWV